MNLFDMTDPKKAEEAKRLEAKRDLADHPEQWHTCDACGCRIHPQFEGRIGERTLCLTCYTKERKSNQ